MAKDVPVEIGFTGGGNTAVNVPEDQVEALTTSIKEGARDPWYSVRGSDGSEFILDLSKVVFVRVAATNRTIGFAHA